MICGAALEQRDVEAEPDQVLGRLDADEAAADDDRTQLPACASGSRCRSPCRRIGRGRSSIQARIWPASGTVRTPKIPGRSMPGSGRPDGGGPGREHELVVALGGHLAGRESASWTVFAAGVDRRRPRSSCGPRRRTASRKVSAVATSRLDSLLDHAADEVRQAAVRVRDVRAALHDEDLGALVEPAQARRARGPTGDSADDDDFHSPTFPIAFFRADAGLPRCSRAPCAATVAASSTPVTTSDEVRQQAHERVAEAHAPA